MKIEIVEFYPSKIRKNQEIGSLHIYIIPFNMDLRGISVYKKKNGFYFQFPQYKGEVDGKIVPYPIINLVNEKEKKSLVAAVIKQGTEYILKNHPFKR